MIDHLEPLRTESDRFATAIADAAYLSAGLPTAYGPRGLNNFLGAGRRMRFGLEINF